MRSFSLLLLSVSLFLVSGLTDSVAQVNLERISVTERADGEGFVIRYHLTEMADSFTVAQPSAERIQMKLFASEMADATTMFPALTLPQGSTVFSDFMLHQVPGGLGIDITLESGNYFLASAYPDQNQRDVLLALEYTSEAELKEITSVTDPYRWGDDAEEPDAVEETERAESEREEQAVVVEESDRERIDVKFGVRAGFSQSNFLNKTYSNDPRTEVVIGVPVDIRLPVYVPGGFRLGIESGVYYYQQGIENPSEQFDAQFVKIDYLKVPVLAKFNYPLMDWVEPHFVAGPYFGFMVSSESETAAGRMNDLDNFTTEVDLGGVIGLGTDLIIGNTILNARLDYSVGFKPVFTAPEESEEIHSVISVLVGITF